MLLALGMAAVWLGTAAGSQGLQFGGSTGVDAVTQQILWDIRLPRSLGAWLGGALLGLAGAVAQGLFRNPLADPYLLGSASGASLGVGLCLSWWGASTWAMGSWLGLGLTGAAFVGAVLAVLLTLLSLLQPQVLQAMQGFMLGSTAFVSWSACLTLALVLAVCNVPALAFARVLDALTLGESTAQSLGVPLSWARMVLVVVIALATGAAVAHIGLVAFVGLAAPHLVRTLVRCTHAWRVILSALMGGALLVLADVMARVLFAPQELPVGVLTAVLGGGYLLWRMYRDADSRSGDGGRA